ncbi:hypothetical protein Tco_1506733 [Tanacetum coccineum]
MVFKDSYSPEDSREEHMEIGTANAEAVTDLSIGDGVGAHTEDGICMGVKIAASDIREDEEEFETAQRQLEASQLMASGERAGGDMTITRSGMTPKEIEELIVQRVAKALANYEATRAANALEAESQSQNGNDGDNGNGRNGNGGNRNGNHVTNPLTHGGLLRWRVAQRGELLLRSELVTSGLNKRRVAQRGELLLRSGLLTSGLNRFIQPNNDPLALVSDASVQQYPTQPSKSKEPSPADNFQMDSGSSSIENLIESNTLTLLSQSYKSHLLQTNNQLRASSNARNKAMQKCVRGQNSGGMINHGAAKHQVLTIVTESEAYWFDEQSLFLEGDRGPHTSQHHVHRQLTSEDPIYDEAGPSYDSNNPFEVQDHDAFVDHMDEYHEVHEMQNDVQHNYVVDSDADRPE